ncbi:MAG: MBL fold metallo-hydrolase [Alphaproteobacteria bacterium]|nr:MBL fold metallo-hydrolase [Alphaproteobacteria bacterium]MBN2674898.1 MBL fold metallo-hydrolase [Alphaproteobacteria bacterium]
MQIRIETLRMPPKSTNSVLVSVGNECVIFDAWGKVSDWDNALNNRGYNLRAIYATHGHSDHISAAPGLAEKYNVPWYLNHKDLEIVLPGNSYLGYFDIPEIPDDYKKPLDLSDGEIEIFPGLPVKVIEYPGHSKGCVVFYFYQQGILIVGDLIFQESFGRYDYPGGDGDELFTSITSMYNKNFPDDTIVIHGHGNDTTIKWLKENNKYFKQHRDLPSED